MITTTVGNAIMVFFAAQFPSNLSVYNECLYLHTAKQISKKDVEFVLLCISFPSFLCILSRIVAVALPDDI